MEPSLRTEIRSYYERTPERDRLELSVFRLEFARTKEMIGRSLPQPPAVILDIGGGPGRYAAWLAALGYEVHLIDPGIEGPGWLLADFDDRWRHPRRREDLLRAARAFETVPSVRGISAHLLAVGKRPWPQYSRD